MMDVLLPEAMISLYVALFQISEQEAEEALKAGPAGD